ncbi:MULTISPECIES: hypothetical protein [unclassified Streptomyces]|uniref:hypothetical protein n=1 Tax=unclassified Streptomyces TaxID=2593676 RepID=UPI00190B28D0|nr:MULTISPECIES: hypothetical protein [unclassified Streptomyces]MBK3563217.1 hypothetical protein [Streptomyces sp. MBT62]MBK6013206.1 hypothetical protein [Streptomyces sp. MBT53]
MPKKTLPRHRLAGAGWAHPYAITPFSPFLYADGGDGGGSGSGSGDAGGDGGSGNGSGSGDGGNSGGGDSGQGAGSGGTGGDSGNGDQGKAGEDDAAKVKRLEKALADANREAGKARTAAKQQAANDAVADLTAKLGKALGLVKDDTPPDPAKLAEAIAQKDTTISEREAALRTKDVELAVWSRAEKLSAKAGALLDSRSFLREIADLNPSDKGFLTALDTAIKDALKENPTAFGTTQAAGKSGADLSGGTGESGAKKRSGSLAGAISNHYQT